MNQKLKFILALIVINFAFAAHSQVTKKKEISTPNMLCVGNYWTEDQGKAFLESQKKLYSNKQEWDKRAQLIKMHILKGLGLEKYPTKCPLKARIGTKRVFDGYQVQNVAFESLPGVFVTGSLYTPTNSKGKLPGIISPHGHWSKPGDVGRALEININKPKNIIYEIFKKI